MTDPVDTTGVHFVRTPRGPLKSRWQVYAWRGGPSILTVDQVAKPRLTPAALGKLVDAHKTPKTKPAGDTFDALAVAYLGSPEFLTCAADTKKAYRHYITLARDEFKGAKVKWFDDPSMRADLVEFRARWRHKSRAAEYAMQSLSVVFAWGAQRGWLATNPASFIAREYEADSRADIVWLDHEIDKVAAHMQPHVARAFRLAAWTGLARTDLVKLRWDEIGKTHIERKRNKTAVETVIPLFDQTRALLKQFPKTALTVVTNVRGKPFTPAGFSAVVDVARGKAGIKGKTLHDLRGTFATRLMRAGVTDDEIDEILGWEPGKSTAIRRKYISRKAVVLSVVERLRKQGRKK